MPTSHRSVLQALEEYFARALTPEALSAGPLLRVQPDPGRPSPCDLRDVDEYGMVGWRPVLRLPPGDFSSVEEVAGVPLHPDARDFLGGFWARSFEVTYERESGLHFIPAFSADEQQWTRRLAGQRSHIAATRAEARPVTVFIGNSADDRYFSVENATGEVLLEDFGRPPRVLAPSLVEFLSSLDTPF